MNIDVYTKMITLIGTPLTQSFSVRMQNAAYEAAGVNLCYFNTDTGEEHLKEVIEGIRYMPSFTGCAVTKPDKVEVLQYLDSLDPLCEMMKACNTMVKQADGSLVGYNTDALGFYTSFSEECDINPAETEFFCYGAGGAGRAICSILAHKGAKKIYITDLIRKRSESLSEDINRKFPGVAAIAETGDCSMIPTCNVVINATGVGMGKSAGESPMPTECIRTGQLYYDACYNPLKTQFLVNAEEKGCRILNGLGMLVYQGAAQFELWTGQSAPVEVMKQEIIKILAERSE